MFGFVFFAFFTFGTSYRKMSELNSCFFEVFSMLLGQPIYDALYLADPVMAPIFFFTFYVLFYLVMKNVFVSILMTGYDNADHKIKRQKEQSTKKSKGLFRTVVDDLRPGSLTHTDANLLEVL